MDNDEKNPSPDFPLLSLRIERPLEAKRVEINFIDMSPQEVSVRRNQDRRRQFFRRWLWRGMDELRRRQVNVEPPDPGLNLDEQI